MLIPQFIIALLLSTGTPEKTNMEVFEAFHFYFAAKNYDSLAQTLSDDFLLLDEKGYVVDNKENYMKYMAEWNNAFGTVWKVHEVHEENNLIIAIESDSDIYLTYTYEERLPFKFIYTIQNGRITQLQYMHVEGINYDSFFSRSRRNQTNFRTWLQREKASTPTYFDKQNLQTAIATKKLFEEYLKTK